MNLVRTLFPALTLALAIGSSTGCGPKKPPGTNPPGDDGGQSADGGGGGDGGGASDGGGAGDGGGDDGGGDGGGKACEAKVADAPTPLFGEKVLIRPPANVELVEDNPTFATTFASAGFVSACDATVDRMSIFVFQSDPAKKIGAYMDEVINDMLTKSGFNGGTPGEPMVDTETEMHKAVEYAAADGQPPAKLYIVVTRKFENIFVVIYQTRPDEFGTLKPTFKASAESLLVIPPDA